MSMEREQLRSELNLDERIQAEIVDNLARLGPATFVVSALNAVIAFFVLRDTSSRAAISAWLVFMLALIVGRMLMVVIYWRLGKDELRIGPWLSVYLVLVWLTGIGWGVLSLTSAFAEESSAWGFIIFLTAGMAAGGLVTLYVKLSAVIPYLVLILFPLIYVLAKGTHPADFAMSVLGGLFLITMVRTSYYLNSMVIRTIRLEAENQYLFEFLVKARRQNPLGSST